MTIRFRDIMTRTDWMKVTVLVAVAVGFWVWVYREYQKPIIPPEWFQDGVRADAER